MSPKRCPDCERIRSARGYKPESLPEEFWISLLTLRNYVIKYLPHHYLPDLMELLTMEEPEKNLWGAINIAGNHLDNAINDGLLPSMWPPRD